MDILSTGVTILASITKFVGSLLKKAYQAAKPVAEEKAGELLDKLSVEKVNLTFSKLTNEVKTKMTDPAVAKVAVCDLKELTALHPNVPEWAKLTENGVTHMLITLGNDGNVTAAYFYQDLSMGADQQVKEMINRTGEGMVVINA